MADTGHRHLKLFFCSVNNTKRNRYSIIALLSIIFAISGYWYYANTERHLFEAIPRSALLIAEIPDAQHTFKQLVGTDYWRDWQFVDAVGRLERAVWLLDTLLLSRNPNDTIQHLLASLHLTKADDYDYLLAAPADLLHLPLQGIAADIKAKGFSVKKRTFRQAAIYEIELPMLQQTYTMAEQDGILLASSNPVLVDEAIDEYSRWTSNGFWRKTWFDGQSTDINCYLNTQNFPLLSNVFFKNDRTSTSIFEQINNMSKWAVLHFQFTQRSVLFNGKASTGQDSNFWSNLLSAPTEDQSNLPHIIPFDAALLVTGSCQDLSYYLRHNNSTELNKNALSWLGNEWGYGFGEPSGTDVSSTSFLIWQMNDSLKASQILQQFEEKRSDQSLPKVWYKGAGLRPANLEAFAQLVLKPSQASAFQNAYYAFYKNYVIFAPQASYLKVLLEKAELNQTLSNYTEYQKISINATQAPKLLLYIQPARMKHLLRGLASPTFVPYIDAKYDYYKKMSPIAAQFDLSGGEFSIKGELSYNEHDEHTNTAIWNVQLDDMPIGEPHVVPLGAKNGKGIFIQDRRGNLYLISGTGKMLWKKNVEKPILSNIYATDFYRNGVYYYLFNTAEKIFLFDSDGENVQDYPLRLPSQANAGLSLIDFDDDHNYVFFVPCGKNKVYGYEYSGRPLTAWHPKYGLGEIEHPFMYVKQKGKDYLASVDGNGMVCLMNRNGGMLKKISLESPLVGEPQMDARWGKPRIVCTLRNQKTYHIDLSGELWSRNYINLSQTADFLTENISGKDTEECIFMSNDKVYAFAQDKRLFAFSFPKGISPSNIFSVKLAHEKNDFVGVFCEKAQKIYLLTGTGQALPDFPLNATTPFVVADLMGSGDNVLVAGGVGSSVFAYQIK